MSATKETDIDFDKVAKALEELAATPNPKAMTLMDQLREERIYNAIVKAKDAGWKSDKIVPILREYGIEISINTFDQYWRTIQSDTASDTSFDKKTGNDGRSVAKPKATKNVRAATEEPKVTKTKPDEKSATPETTPATASGGKRLTKRPDMGSAFNPDEL